MATRAGIKVILCSLLPANKYNWRPSVQPAALIKDMNIRIKELCNQKGYAFVDFWTPFADSSDGLPAAYSSDGVHPNQACYTIMEGIILPVIRSVTSGSAPSTPDSSETSTNSFTDIFSNHEDVDIL